MKLMVIGHARHGKDTVCEMLKKHYGLSFESSSRFFGEIAVRPYLAARGIIYPNWEAMYEDRVNHRAAWFEAIKGYGQGDPARLGRELFAKYDIYCGLRNIVELNAIKAEGMITATLWVDASKRLPPEPTSSMNVGPESADFIIDSNGNLDRLLESVHEAYAFSSCHDTRTTYVVAAQK